VQDAASLGCGLFGSALSALAAPSNEKHVVVYADAQNVHELPWRIERNDQWQASMALRRFDDVARKQPDTRSKISATPWGAESPPLFNHER
jgi:hypothetical protein